MTSHLDQQVSLERNDALGLAEVQGRQAVDAGQLVRGIRVVVDAQVGEDAAVVAAGFQGTEHLVDVGDACQRLGRHGADAEPDGGHDGADGQEPARYRDAPGVAVASGDGEGHGRSVWRPDRRRSSRTVDSRWAACGDVSKRGPRIARTDSIDARPWTSDDPTNSRVLQHYLRVLAIRVAWTAYSDISAANDMSTAATRCRAQLPRR